MSTTFRFLPQRWPTGKVSPLKNKHFWVFAHFFPRLSPCFLALFWPSDSLTCWSRSGWEPHGCRSRTGWASGGGCSGSAGVPRRRHSAGPSKAADSAGCTAEGHSSAGAAAYSSGPDGWGLAGSGGSVSAGWAADGRWGEGLGGEKVKEWEGREKWQRKQRVTMRGKGMLIMYTLLSSSTF